LNPFLFRSGLGHLTIQNHHYSTFIKQTLFKTLDICSVPTSSTCLYRFPNFPYRPSAPLPLPPVQGVRFGGDFWDPDTRGEQIPAIIICGHPFTGQWFLFRRGARRGHRMKRAKRCFCSPSSGLGSQETELRGSPPQNLQCWGYLDMKRPPAWKSLSMLSSKR